VIVKLGKLNLGPGNFSCILSGEDARNVDDSLLDAHLSAVQMIDDYFADIIHFLSTCIAPPDFKVVQKKQLV